MLWPTQIVRGLKRSINAQPFNRTRSAERCLAHCRGQHRRAPLYEMYTIPATKCSMMSPTTVSQMN